MSPVTIRSTLPVPSTPTTPRNATSSHLVPFYQAGFTSTDKRHLRFPSSIPPRSAPLPPQSEANRLNPAPRIELDMRGASKRYGASPDSAKVVKEGEEIKGNSERGQNQELDDEQEEVDDIVSKTGSGTRLERAVAVNDWKRTNPVSPLASWEARAVMERERGVIGMQQEESLWAGETRQEGYVSRRMAQLEKKERRNGIILDKIRKGVAEQAKDQEEKVWEDIKEYEKEYEDMNEYEEKPEDIKARETDWEDMIKFRFETDTGHGRVHLRTIDEEFDGEDMGSLVNHNGSETSPLLIDTGSKEQSIFLPSTSPTSLNLESKSRPQSLSTRSRPVQSLSSPPASPTPTICVPQQPTHPDLASLPSALLKPSSINERDANKPSRPSTASKSTLQYPEPQQRRTSTASRNKPRRISDSRAIITSVQKVLTAATVDASSEEITALPRMSEKGCFGLGGRDERWKNSDGGKRKWWGSRLGYFRGA